MQEQIIIPFQVTELFDKLVKDEPDKIQCQEEKHALNAVLKINVSDPSSGPLRIPKQNKRPEDITLASGYKSKYNTLASSTSGGLGKLNLAFEESITKVLESLNYCKTDLY